MNGRWHARRASRLPSSPVLNRREDRGMPEYRIRRDGQQYLVFSGSLAAEASDRLRHGQEQDRWTDIRVYRTDTGSYVVEQVTRTLSQKGDAVWYQGDLCPTPQDVYRALVG